MTVGQLYSNKIYILRKKQYHTWTYIWTKNMQVWVLKNKNHCLSINLFILLFKKYFWVPTQCLALFLALEIY